MADNSETRPFRVDAPEAGPGGPRVLGRRALSRATLERQLLLRRHDLPVAAVVEHLVGLQAQTTQTWYTGLWTRIEGFRPEDASDLLAGRELVRVALMRSTIHLVTAADCLALRPVVQPAMERGLYANRAMRPIAGLDLDKVVAAGRELLDELPRTTAELGALLHERFPEGPPNALASVVRNLATLVQVPPRGLWGGSGQTRYATAETWLGRPLDPAPSVERTILRYLGAFGPATVKDVQTWSGLTRLGEVLDRLRPGLVTFRDERGQELFDLPEAPRPGEDVPAPPRFLYDFDNLLLSHADRSRVQTEACARTRSHVKNGLVPGAVLVDGFTAANWKISRGKEGAVLEIQPYAALSPGDADAVVEEGARLLGFAAAGAAAHDVRILPPVRG
ncbi:winged helix DNA-binding domain-containing protein [Microtetraspora niveoalba]|uniref:winged helix DNA-binding domain-containing protein n=1 Tax=Microtetraspora niveoalba TaxID=46175 RepID=UPI0009FBF5B1|nr:winged helix DNA-binding domain-containing protein [Microtetraspora niveoalba]